MSPAAAAGSADSTSLRGESPTVPVAGDWTSSAVAPTNVKIDRRVEGLVRRALEKDREDRYATTQEFAEALLAGESGSTGLLPMLRGLFRRKK